MEEQQRTLPVKNKFRKLSVSSQAAKIDYQHKARQMIKKSPMIFDKKGNATQQPNQPLKSHLPRFTQQQKQQPGSQSLLHKNNNDDLAFI